MAPKEAGDLSARIRADVERGRPRDEIVAGLVQGGLSKPSAERFVDRAIAARDSGPPSPPAKPPATSDADAAEDPGGRGSLIAGAFWLSFGCSITGITYLLAKPGGKYMLAYGAVVAGLLAFGRGLKRFWDAGPAPFPWKAVVIAGLVPLAGMAGLVGYVKGRGAMRRAAVQRAADGVRETREAEAHASEERSRAAAVVAVSAKADQERAQQETAYSNALLKLLRNPRTEGYCEVSRKLGERGVREAIPDLEVRLRDPSSGPRGCAASALVALGEIDAPLAFYLAEAQSPEANIRRSGLMGFAEIGPRAAAAGLPYFVAALQSPDSDDRWLAVDALSKMGPEGVPLLRSALDDSDRHVKNKAAESLAQMGER